MNKLIVTSLAVALGVVTVLILPARGAAQSPSELLIGQPTTAVNLPVERGFINVQNGNLHIEIPFAAYKGRGDLSTSFKMVYDSMIWHGVDLGSGNYQWQPNNVPNSNGGWRFVSSLPGGLTGGAPVSVVCGSSVDQYGPFFINTLDGTQHTFPIATISNPRPPAAAPLRNIPILPEAPATRLMAVGTMQWSATTMTSRFTTRAERKSMMGPQECTQWTATGTTKT